MKKRALFELIILAVTFWAVWSLQFFGIGYIGLLTMVAGVSVGFLLLRQRQQAPSSIGLGALRQPGAWLRSRVLGAAAVIALITYGGAALLIPLLGPLQASSAITSQPETIVPFLLDIIFGVWLGAALGEEIFFRGLLLSRFETLFGSLKQGQIMAISAQAIWFGAGHASQGVTGMALTGLIGFGIGLYYVRRCEGSLWPLILAHGLIDTFVFGLNFIGNG